MYKGALCQALVEIFPPAYFRHLAFSSPYYAGFDLSALGFQKAKARCCQPCHEGTRMLQSSVKSCDPFSAVLGGTQILASKPGWSRPTMLRERGGGGSKEAKKNNCLGINLMA